MAAVPPGVLVSPGQLGRYNVPSAFLAQFEPRPLEVQISTGGALGVMTFAWRWAGESNFSAVITSDAGATWSYTIEDAFVDLVFATLNYTAGTLYAINRLGVVTGGAGVTATRFDRRTTACSAATSEAMTLMRDAIRPPLLSWGDDATTHAAQLVYALLKRGTGLAPVSGAPGDENVIKAEDIARKFFNDIGENGKPDSMIDSSPSLDGPLLPAYPSGDDSRGW